MTNTPPAAQSLEQRFWAKVDKRGPDECWPWTHNRHERGYGRFVLGGKVRRAHRIAWWLATGDPAPSDKFVCHRCDNPGCVNPSHLWIGSPRDNVYDMIAKGRHGHLRKTHCCRGHKFTPENTYLHPRRGRDCRACRKITRKDRKGVARNA